MRKKIINLFLLLFMITMLFTAKVYAFSGDVGNRDWRWPVPASRNISSCFPNYCGHRSLHRALDITGGYGSSIYASYEGTVLYASASCNRNFRKPNAKCTCGKGYSCLGNFVYIKHSYKGKEYVSRYGHMQNVYVKTGDRVTKSTVIGTVGSTGASTGPHLDFTIWKGSSTSKPSNDYMVDPFLNQFLEASPVASLTHEGCSDNYVDQVKALYKDNKGPTFNQCVFKNKTKNGFTISCLANDPSGIRKVEFLVWPNEKGDWSTSKTYKATLNGNEAVCNVNIANHNNYDGKYTVHVQAWDKEGNYTYQEFGHITMDTKAPEITNMHFENMSDTEFRIACDIKDDSKIKRVEFLVWPDKNGDWSSGATYIASVNGTSAYYDLKIENHNNHEGRYDVRVQAWDECDNYVYQDFGSVRTRTPADDHLVAKVSYKNHTYEVYDYSTSWKQAKALCEAWGGHLVTINDVGENAFITNLVKKGFKNSYYIGCTDEEREGEWKWITGEPFSYKNWDPHLPEPSGEDYGCIVARENLPNKTPGEWMDNDDKDQSGTFYSYTNAGFICEVDNIVTHTHNYKVAITKAATCTSTGNKTYRCTCGDSYSKTISALGHSYGGWTITEKATAIAAGQQKRVCSLCKHVEYKSVSRLKATGTLNSTNFPLKVKQSATLKVSGMAYGDSVKKWSSSKTAYATVDKNGRVTGKKKGTATITATLASGKKLTATVKVQNKTVKTTSVTVKTRNVTLTAGKKYQLTSSRAPFTSGYGIKYSSKNSAIATVSGSGKITAKKPGTTYVYVKSGSKSVTVKVKVEGIKTTKLTANVTSYTLKRNKSFRWKVTRTPSNSSEGITYTSSNKKIAKVDRAGKITGKRNGTVTITATSGKKKVSVRVTVK